MDSGIIIPYENERARLKRTDDCVGIDDSSLRTDDCVGPDDASLAYRRQRWPRRRFSSAWTTALAQTTHL